MNFMSHYYFDRFVSSSPRVVGAVLPDLLRNADPQVKLRPKDFESLFLGKSYLEDLYIGWKRHLEIDRIFHNTAFFFAHTKALKAQLVPALAGLPIRPSFFAHIALELLLDHQLIMHKKVEIADFYSHLESTPDTQLTQFFAACGYAAEPVFINHYRQFISWEYIYKYTDIMQITSMLFSISKHLWHFDVQDEQRQAISAVLRDYALHSMSDYPLIYQEIQNQLHDFE